MTHTIEKSIKLGIIDCIRILLVSFSLFIPQANAQSSGLVAAYNFDEGSGSIVIDRSGRGNNGSISNATWNKAGKYGGSLSFNGSYSLVSIKDSNSLDLTTGMTLAAWVYPTSSLKSWPTIILKEQTSNLSYSLYANSDFNKPSGVIFTTAEISARGSNLLPLNTWTHLAVTYDGAYIRFYVNAVLTGTTPKTGQIATSTSPLRIGGNKLWPGEYFAGRIDDVRIYNRALSASEIREIMSTAIKNDLIPPSVSMTAPASGSTISGNSIAISANASDNVGVTGVQFKMDGVNLGAEDVSSPYSIVFDSTNATNGNHVLTAVARDAAGNTTTANNITINVSNNIVTWTRCAEEYQTCSFSGTREVRYGTETNFVTKIFTGNAYCGNSTFITDPAFGLDKYCQYSSVVLAPPPVDTTAPTVSITSPANGATVSGNSVTISGNASDNVGVSGVQFKLDGVNLGVEDTSSPYSVVLNTTSVVNGTHVLTAIARDAAGNTATAANVSINISNNIITWTRCAEEYQTCSFSGTREVRYGTETNFVTKIFTGNVFCGNSIFITDPAVGANKSCWYSSVVLASPPVDTTAPTISMNSPANGSTVSGSSVFVSANASDNVGVAGVQFKLDGSNLGAEDTSNPFSVILDSTTLSNGNHTLTAIARDAAGNTATTTNLAINVSNNIVTWTRCAEEYQTCSFSGTREVRYGTETTFITKIFTGNVFCGNSIFITDLAVGANKSCWYSSVILASPPIDTIAPTVSITAPANGTTVSGNSVTVSANASDNVSVAGVQFKLDGLNLGNEDTSSPYSVVFNTTSVGNGNHVLTAIARDASGNTSTAANVTVNVSNTSTPPPPPPTDPSCVNPNFLGMHWHRDVANLSGAGPTISNYPFEFGMHRLMSKEGKIRWSAVNPSPGVFDWSDLDKVAARLPAGAKMELVIADPPGHARDTAVWNGSCGNYNWGFCAVKTASLQEYVRAFLTRYGSKVGSIDPANEWNLASSYGRGTDDELDAYAAGPVSSLVKAIRDIRAVLNDMGRSDVILWMGSTTGARQQFSLIDRFPELKTTANGAQIHCYEQTAANWGSFEPNDYCSVMRQRLDERGLAHWKLSDGEHGITGGTVNEWWNTLVHFASLGWYNVGVYSGDDDGDGAAPRGANPINNPAAAAMFQKFHTEIAGRKIVNINKSTPMWTVTTQSCQ